MPRRAAGRHSPFYDLLDALRQPGCALCSLAARTRWRYLDNLAYENVNDIATRQKLRVALGFCNRHAWFFVEEVREVFGAGIIYRDLLHAVQRRAARENHIADPFQPDGACIACLAESAALADTTEMLVESLDTPDLREALRASAGICVPHLRRALATSPSGTREALLRLVGEAWEASSGDSAILRNRAVGASGCLGVDERVFDDSTPRTTSMEVATSSAGDAPFCCTVCQAVQADLAKFASWRALDDEVSGICNVHAWQEAGADAADLYRRQILAGEEGIGLPVTSNGKSFLAQAIHGLGFARAPATPRWGSLWIPLRCVVCRHQATLETNLCAEARGTQCVPHLRRAVAIGNRDAITRQHETWRTLDHLLGEYIRKEDYRFRGEPRGIEQSSPRWAVALIAGEPGIR